MSSGADGINNVGQVVGWSFVGGDFVATEWSGGSIINLGGLPASDGQRQPKLSTTPGRRWDGVSSAITSPPSNGARRQHHQPGKSVRASRLRKAYGIQRRTGQAVGRSDFSAVEVERRQHASQPWRPARLYH